MRETRSDLTNWEIAVYALYLCDGCMRSVHTEDVAIKCFELAPRSFSWLKHTEYPDKDIARLALCRARQTRITSGGALVSVRSGRGFGRSAATGRAPRTDGWRLTEAGAAWITNHETRIRTVLGGRIDTSRRQEPMRKLGKVLDHPLFRAFEDRRTIFEPAIGQVADLLRCRVDAEESVWRRRFDALLGQARLAEQSEVVEFLRACEAAVFAELEGKT